MGSTLLIMACLLLSCCITTALPRWVIGSTRYCRGTLYTYRSRNYIYSNIIGLTALSWINDLVRYPGGQGGPENANSWNKKTGSTK